eukprot:Hpha_TRINITY_DN15616_c4_g6::TRINITY_DN15616_c4_g6_i1::g.101728::m.101728/K10393/KIF2_24, MCAK; kinesin family member 2/24
MATQRDPLLLWLERAGLGQHYATLKAKGITLSTLSTLTMQDYNGVGVSTMADRKKLFQLIQSLKRESPESLRQAAAPPTSQAEVWEEASILAQCQAMPLGDGRDAAEGGIFERADLARTHSTPSQSSPSNAPRGGGSAPAPAAAQPAVTDPRYPSPQAGRSQPITRQASGGAVGGGAKAGKAKIRVCVRMRPLTKSELERGDTDIMRSQGGNTILVDEKRTAVDLTQYVCPHEFIFDEVFIAGTSNEAVYNHTAQPLIETVFEGGRATCFAYGQTGSGKTHTMLGKGSSTGSGLYVLASRDIFARLQDAQFCTCNYYEIYGNKCYDLLQGRARLEVREDGGGNVNICGLTDHRVSSVEALMQIIEDGSGVRAQGSTSANVDSSRSHAVLSINVCVPGRRGREAEVFGRFSFIDLAGSERGSDAANSDKVTRVEGAEINKSLLALKECIRALDQSARHIPFRGSKLTEVLRESFVGNSRTAMIACVAPGSAASEDTLNTLRYADRVKSLTRPPGSRSTTDDFDPVTMTGNVGRRKGQSNKSRGNRLATGAGGGGDGPAAAAAAAVAAASSTTPSSVTPGESPRGGSGSGGGVGTRARRTGASATG